VGRRQRAIADGRLGRFEPNLWYRVLGPTTSRSRCARRTARIRLRSSSSTTSTTDRNGVKVNALYKLVKRLRAQRVPLNGIGFQAHVRLDSHPSTQELTKIMRRFTRLGLRVEVTELDVPLGGSAPLDEQLAAQAQVYAQIAAACRQVAAVGHHDLGFTDASTWLGTDQRPLPFDADYKPKPAFFALLKAAGARETVPQP